MEMVAPNKALSVFCFLLERNRLERPQYKKNYEKRLKKTSALLVFLGFTFISNNNISHPHILAC